MSFLALAFIITVQCLHLATSVLAAYVTEFVVISDLYDAWLAPHFATSMEVETWRNGGEPLASNCSGKYHVCFFSAALKCV